MSAAPVLVASVVDRDRHDTGLGHPERAARLAAVSKGLRDDRVAQRWRPIEGRDATVDELARVHAPAYLDGLRSLVDTGGGHLDPDTVTSAGSWSTAVAAAGAVLAAVEALEAGTGDAAFVGVRPPGHHATAARAMGFCLLNNVAVAAAALVARGERVLVVDYDVHHGNGTQDIFWDDPAVLYCSVHQSNAFPGTGRPDEVGGASALGLTANVPVPPGATGDVVLAALDEIVVPAAEVFDPTWLLVSAGFDGHRDDPLADLALSAGDYGLLSARLADLAPRRGRTVVVLEGGYDLEALTRCTVATVAALSGERVDPEAPTAGGPGLDAVRAARALREAALRGARADPASAGWFTRWQRAQH